MNIGLYFGSFNPVHIGHLIIANHISNFTFLDEVWFIISPQNPFKINSTLLDEYKRKELIDLSIKGEKKLKSSDIEFFLPRPSYTINTLHLLKETFPNYTFTIIMGSDSFENIHAWKDFQQLINQYQILVYTRSGHEIKKDTYSGITEIQAPLLDISSTQIRQMIKDGRSIKFLVPDVIKHEIEKNNYYK